MNLEEGESFDLVILAGGEGSRMGGCIKPLLTRPDGSTLLEASIKTLARPGDPVWVVAPAKQLEVLIASVAPASANNVRGVEDRGEGPGRAILTAAHRSQNRWLVIAGGDLLEPSSELLAIILAAAEGWEGAWIIDADGYPQTMMSVVDRGALLKQLEGKILTGNPSVRSLFAPLRMRELLMDTLKQEVRRGFVDIDTPAEAAHAGLSYEGKRFDLLEDSLP